MTLIDGDKLADSIRDKLCDHLYCWDCSMCLEDGGCKVEEWIDKFPSADRPQGEWIKRFGLINCSVCKHSNWSDSFEDLLRSFNYCPNCGARMKGADDE